MTATTDVLIVGAGPTGLMLAGDLATRGVPCTLIERRLGEANTTRAFAVHARTLEQMDARGLADALISTGASIGDFVLYGRLKISLSHLPSRFPFVVVTPQYQVERLLEQRATEAGARIVRGVSFAGLSQDAEGVDVRVEAAGGEPAEDAQTHYRARYVVGTDGVHSAVREAIGLPFPGSRVLQSIMLADVKLSDPPAEILSVDAGDEGFAFIAPFGDGWYRVFAWNRVRQVDDSEPVELDEVRHVVRDAFGTDFGMGEARWLSRFHSDERQVPRYRVGRAFLAGDAAHCHSPAGGQGMNTGLQDAANLGWKLAAAVQGWRSV
jgi:2-polyprenyl-6-methoxyphenol hydroxylase-like FAD-dependent oxidoreductase